jgi:hypothetical protein
MEGNDSLPVLLLVCCEGKQTEPQYFNIVVKQRKINVGRAKVKVVGGRGQHQVLIDETAAERERMCRSLELTQAEIEAWAVCDKDQMACSLQELEEYAAKNQINLAFSDPRFEIFLLQHFTRSSTNDRGKGLETLLGKHLESKGHKPGYTKEDLKALYKIFDNEPLLLEAAIENSGYIQDKDNTPYTTAHLLLARLLAMGPRLS